MPIWQLVIIDLAFLAVAIPPTVLAVRLMARVCPMPGEDE